MENLKLKPDESLENLKGSVSKIEAIIRAQQSCIVDNALSIKEREKVIDELKRKLAKAQEKLNVFEDDIKVLKIEKEQLSKDFKDLSIRGTQQQQTFDELTTTHKKLSKANQELTLQYSDLKKQCQESIIKERNNQIENCKSLLQLFNNIREMLTNEIYTSSPFKRIRFVDNIHSNIFDWLNKEIDIKVSFDDSQQRDFEKDLFAFIENNIDILSKIIRLYLYGRIDEIVHDLNKYLNVIEFNKNVEEMLAILAMNRIFVNYPIPFFDSYSPEMHVLEMYNDINQINPNYINNLNMNKIIEISKIGLVFRQTKIKPTITRKI